MSYLSETGDWRSAPHAVTAAVSHLRSGGMLLVTDAEDRENEADLVVAAEFVTNEQMAFIIRHSTGIVCAPMDAERCDALRLPQMVSHNSDPLGTAFTVSVDAAGTGTGVSAAERVLTLKTLARADTAPGDLRRPGHVFPLRARSGGVLMRPGHTESAVDLMHLAGLGGVGVIAEVVADDGTMMRGERLEEFAAAHKLPIISIADVVRHRHATERLVEAVSSSRLPTRFGDFQATVYTNTIDGVDNFVLTMGDIEAASAMSEGVLVRVHSECLSGDTFGSLKCDCGDQLARALAAIAEEGCGALVYLRGHEGRGIGLAHKIRAYALQETGLDTVDANVALGLPIDSRSYGTGAQILTDLGITRIRLMTNNPAKHGGLEGFGIDIVGRVALQSTVSEHNVRYLQTKRDRLGHTLPADSALQPGLQPAFDALQG
jgi:3,4-dihydroxy 2-butanone 4-phosphate synthase/GTP cyclohydrolase II